MPLPDKGRAGAVSFASLSCACSALQRLPTAPGRRSLPFAPASSPALQSSGSTAGTQPRSKADPVWSASAQGLGSHPLVPSPGGSGRRARGWGRQEPARILSSLQGMGRGGGVSPLPHAGSDLCTGVERSREHPTGAALGSPQRAVYTPLRVPDCGLDINKLRFKEL